MKSVGVYFTAPAPLDNGPELPGKLVTKLEADSPLMIGEFASKGDAVDHVVLVNLSLERTAKVQLKELRSLGKLEEYSPEDGHLAKCGADVYLAGGAGGAFEGDAFRRIDQILRPLGSSG